MFHGGARCLVPDPPVVLVAHLTGPGLLVDGCCLVG